MEHIMKHANKFLLSLIIVIDVLILFSLMTGRIDGFSILVLIIISGIIKYYTYTDYQHSVYISEELEKMKKLCNSGKEKLI